MQQFKQPFTQPQQMPSFTPVMELSTLVWSMFMVFFGSIVLLAATLIR